MSATTLSRTLAGHWARPGTVDGPYPLRPSRDHAPWARLRDALAGLTWLSPQRVTSAKLVRAVNDLEPWLRAEGDAALERRVVALRGTLATQGVTLHGVAVSFALVRELSRRTLGLRHHDVQLMAGWALLNGRIAEMSTGEGKTLSAALAAGTAALAGVPVHVITVNDYLAARDARTLEPLYARLGIEVGTVCEGDAVEARRAAYRKPIVYCANKQLIFDFLQDQLTLGETTSATRLKLDRLRGRSRRAGELLLQGLTFGIVDEADSVLVDDARTPMILARERKDELRHALYRQALAFATQLSAESHFVVDRHVRRVALTDAGRREAGRICASGAGVWRGERHREQLLTLALTALHAFVVDDDYVVKDGKVCIVDANTGRVLGDRSWQGGLQQIIELKEGLEPSPERETIARISQQRFFSRYLRLAGMTGTAREVRRELRRVYGLRFERIPTHRPSRRAYLGETTFTCAETKWAAVTARIVELERAGHPVLVGTRSIRDSEHLSAALDAAGIAHQVLNARQDAEEAAIIARAGERGRVTVATNMAGRGTDIALAAGVAALGGLHVIACERHEAGRIDRQLFGRAARQGDPGSCERMVALDDEVMVDQLPSWLLATARALAARGRLTPLLARPLGALAQRLAERGRERQRKAVMDADRRTDRLLSFAGGEG